MKSKIVDVLREKIKEMAYHLKTEERSRKVLLSKLKSFKKRLLTDVSNAIDKQVINPQKERTEMHITILKERIKCLQQKCANLIQEREEFGTGTKDLRRKTKIWKLKCSFLLDEIKDKTSDSLEIKSFTEDEVSISTETLVKRLAEKLKKKIHLTYLNANVRQMYCEQESYASVCFANLVHEEQKYTLPRKFKNRLLYYTVAQDKLYTLDYENDFFVHFLGKNSKFWSKKKASPPTRRHHSNILGAYNRVIYSLGGAKKRGPCRSCLKYEIAANTWKEMPELQKPRICPLILLHGNYLICASILPDSEPQRMADDQNDELFTQSVEMLDVFDEEKGWNFLTVANDRIEQMLNSFEDRFIAKYSNTEIIIFGSQYSDHPEAVSIDMTKKVAYKSSLINTYVRVGRESTVTLNGNIFFIDRRTTDDYYYSLKAKEFRKIPPIGKKHF